MSVKVAKFGGSSLADAGQFRKVKSIIGMDETRLFVVPSAPGKRSSDDEKITDMLYQCFELAQAGQLIDGVFERISARYLEIAEELELGFDIRSALSEVKDAIAGGASRDYCASRGEYLNGLLLADYLGFDFVDAAEIIRFDEDGKFLAEKTNELVNAALKGRARVVVPGFYGAKEDGTVQTFSRGGSDITGAIVARGVEAAVYENWTDVSGLLMADPRIVRGAKPIATVTYTELRELAYMGATVMHDEAIFPVRQACIPINVRNTNDPDAPGTMIVPEAEDYSKCAITGIAGRKGFTVISIEKDKMNTEIGFAARLLTALADLGISIEHMPTGIDTLSVIVSDESMNGKQQEVVDAIIAAVEPDFLEVHDNIALIAVVGRGMMGRVGTSSRVFTALAGNGVNIRMIDQGSSEINIIVGVETDQFKAAVRAIYYAFDEE